MGDEPATLSEPSGATAAPPAYGPELLAALGSIADGITLQDGSGRLVWANDAAARLLGFETGAELLAVPPADIIARFELLDEDGEPFPLDRLPGRRVFAGEPAPEATIRYRVRATGDERWSLVSASPLPGPDGQALLAVNLFRDVTGRRRAEARMRFLAEAGEALAESLDTGRTLAGVARLAVPRVADWCMVYVLEADGTIARLAVEHAGGLHHSVLERLRDRPFDPDAATGVPHVLRTGEPLLVPEAGSADVAADVLDAGDVARELEPLGITSWMCVPLVVRGRTLGAISLLAAESRRHFDEDDLAFAGELARRAALAIDNARLFHEAESTAATLDTLLAAAPIGLGFWDTGLRYLRVNEALAEIGGIRPGEHLGRTLRDATPRFADLVEPVLREVLETGRPALDRELVAESAATPGETRHWLASYFPVREADGTTIGVGASVLDVTERRRAEEESGRARARVEFLSEASELLARSLDWDETILRIPSLAVPRLAEACSLYVTDEAAGTLVRVAHAHVDPALERLIAGIDPVYPLDESRGVPVVEAMLAGEPQLVETIGDEMRASAVRNDAEAEALRVLGTASLMLVPLVVRDRTLGLLAFSSREPGRHTQTDFDFARELARRTAVALDRSRLYRDATESLALLDTLLRTAPVGLAFFDTALRFVRVNEALAEMNGVPVEAHLGRTFEEVLPAVDRDILPRVRRVLETGEPLLDAETAGETPAQPGVRRTWQASYYPVRDAVGETLGLGAVVVETTQRRRAEEERLELLRAERRARERLEFLAEASRVLSSSLDYETTLRRVARLAVPDLTDWCGLDMVAADGSLQRLAVAHADPEKVRFANELADRYPPEPDSPTGPYHVLRTGTPELMESVPDELIVQAAKDAEHLELLRGIGFTSYLCVPIRGRETTLGVLTWVTSTPGRQLGEDDLALAEEVARRAAVAIENARLYGEARRRARAVQALRFVGDGVVLLDAEGVVRLWNPAAERITGLAVGEVLGRPAGEAIPGWADIVEHVTLGGRPETAPVEVGGREIWLSVSGAAFPAGTVYAFRDVTSERAIERMKTDFVSTVSHELRTPLAAIYGAAQTLRRVDVTIAEEQREELLGVVAGEADRLARIVNDVLWASRLESGTMPLSVEHADPVEMATSVVRAARIHAPDGIELELVAGGGLPTVTADPDKARQVLANLVENAVKYSPDGGRVELRVEPADGAVRFSVLDEGLGIPPGEEERIWEKFYRLDPNLTRGVGGTGLGLYICRELVRGMGGRIWVERRDGPGSVFAFELPRAAGAEAPARSGAGGRG